MLTSVTYQPGSLPGGYRENLSWNKLPAYMLSAVISSELSYSTVPLTGTIDTPEVRTLRSSRTRSMLPQFSIRLWQIGAKLSHDVLNPARVPL